MKVSLRNYQEEGVRELRRQFAQGHRSVLYVLPTGGGKTVLFCHVAEQAAAKGNRIAILVHRQELVDQTSASLSEIGVDHGIIAAGVPTDLDRPVQVASVQTLVRRLHRLPADFFQLLIVDEAHHATAGSWASVISHYSKACVLGVTATPQRLDGKGLAEKFTSLVLGPQMGWLQSNGFLAQIRCYAPPSRLDHSLLKRTAGDYNPASAAEQTTQPKFVGDAVSHYKKLIFPGTAIAFCCTVEHCKVMAEAFQAAGVRAAALDGTMKKEERRALIKQLGTGEVQVITSCQIISEGTDVPSVAGCLLLRPTESLSMYLQQVGRCLRPAPGKEHAIILDHVGNITKHGHPVDDRKWTLEGRGKKDKSAEAPIKVCPQCYSVVSPQILTCPDCGHVFMVKAKPMTTVEADLIEITQAQVKERRRQIAQARTLEELQQVGAARGYKPGWAHYIYNSRQLRRYGRQQ